jgi:hypothetical protein
MAGKLKPLEVERQITPGKYPDCDRLYLVVAGPTSCKERWHGLGWRIPPGWAALLSYRYPARI